MDGATLIFFIRVVSSRGSEYILFSSGCLSIQLDIGFVK